MARAAGGAQKKTANGAPTKRKAPTKRTTAKRAASAKRKVPAKRAARAAAPSIDARRVQERVLKWFAEHGRAFPWRTHRDPYKTLVAEVMLQQTQTGRVGPSYEAFLQHFPTVSALSCRPATEGVKA